MSLTMTNDADALRAMNIQPLYEKPGIVTVEAVRPATLMATGGDQPAGYFGDRMRYEGDRFQIATWQEFAPTWMKFVDPIPAEWKKKIQERDGTPQTAAVQKPQGELIERLCKLLPAAEKIAEQMQALNRRDAALSRAQDAILGGVSPAVHGFADDEAVNAERSVLKIKYAELQTKLRSAVGEVRGLVAKAGLTMLENPDPSFVLELRTLIRARGHAIPGRAA